MEKDCKETFEAEFEPRGFSMSKDYLGYYAHPNTDFAYRGWEAAWKYDEVKIRIYNGTPQYQSAYYFKAAEGFEFRIDEDGVCHHEKIAEGNASNNTEAK